MPRPNKQTKMKADVFDQLITGAEELGETTVTVGIAGGRFFEITCKEIGIDDELSDPIRRN